MSKKQRKPRIRGTYRVPPELDELGHAIVAKCKARGLGRTSEIPKEIVDEVVHELYGGWNDVVRERVAKLEQWDEPRA